MKNHNFTARYLVTIRQNGRIVARGTAEQCARALGIACSSFQAIASRARHGRSPYRVDRSEDVQWRSEAAARWDQMFGWYRAGKLQYPCPGCVSRALCSYTDQYCPDFARWFAASYNRSASLLRRMRDTGKQLRSGGQAASAPGAPARQAGSVTLCRPQPSQTLHDGTAAGGQEEQKYAATLGPSF